MKMEVVLVDPDQAVHERLRRAGTAGHLRFSLQSYFDGASALAGLQTATPGVVALALDLPDMQGLRCLRSLRALHPALQIVATCCESNADLVFQSLISGANGCVVKPCIMAELVAALFEARDEGAPMNAPARKSLAKALARMNDFRSEEAALSIAETPVFLHLLQREHAKEIATALGVSERTAEVHTGNIFGKFGVGSRLEFIERILHPPPPATITKKSASPEGHAPFP
jgi:DNA-binding NarL/FixJ family response regulator